MLKRQRPWRGSRGPQVLEVGEQWQAGSGVRKYRAWCVPYTVVRGTF